MSKTSASAPQAPQPAMRADARRNHERLLTAAREAFAEHGANAPLEDIAGRAGVGIGTLYRHFPTRLALQEAVYREQVEAVCAGAYDLLNSSSPGDALAVWLRRLVGFIATKRGLGTALISELGRDSELIFLCSLQIKDAGTALLARAQQAGEVRADATVTDLVRLTHAIVVASEHGGDTGQAERLLSMMLDGLRRKA